MKCADCPENGPMFQLRLCLNGTWKSIGAPSCESVIKKFAEFWRKSAPIGGLVKVVPVEDLQGQATRNPA